MLLQYANTEFMSEIIIFAKRSILGVWKGSEYASEWHIETWVIKQMYVYYCEN